MTQQNQRGTEPDIESIARRAIGLARFTQRAQMEMAATQAGNPGIQARMSEMMAPFIQSTLTGGQAEWLSRQERWLFEQPPGSWPSDDVV